MSKIESIVKNIQARFKFLDEYGYKVRHAEYSPQYNGSWVVELESQEAVVYITNDRSFITLELSSHDLQDIRHRVSIEEIVYLLSNGQRIVEAYKGNLAWNESGQIKRLAKILEEFIDQITLYYRNKKQI